MHLNFRSGVLVGLIIVIGAVFLGLVQLRPWLSP